MANASTGLEEKKRASLKKRADQYEIESGARATLRFFVTMGATLSGVLAMVCSWTGHETWDRRFSSTGLALLIWQVLFHGIADWKEDSEKAEQFEKIGQQLEGGEIDPVAGEKALEARPMRAGWLITSLAKSANNAAWESEPKRYPRRFVKWGLWLVSSPEGLFGWLQEQMPAYQRVLETRLLAMGSNRHQPPSP